MIGHIGDDAITERFADRANQAERLLEKMRGHRTLNPTEAAELSSRLQAYGSKTFWLVVERGDKDDRSEQMVLGKQLQIAFSSAGWTRSNLVMQPGQEAPPEFAAINDRGISIQHASDPESRVLGARVADDLRAIGLDCEENEDETQLPRTIVLAVGVR